MWSRLKESRACILCWCLLSVHYPLQNAGKDDEHETTFMARAACRYSPPLE